MKKILLITTGGTIASTNANKQGFTPTLTPDDLLALVEEPLLEVTVDTYAVMNIDSTNMQPEDWQLLAQTIEERYQEYDGFVIAHGTDTMAYTSAALSYMLQNVGKPVVLTGSQVPMGVLGTDAKRNLADAFTFAANGAAGVYVVFCGRVIRGTRAMKMRTQSYDAFFSVNASDVGTVRNQTIIYHDSFQPEEKLGPFQVNTLLCPDVFVLKLHPGVKEELFDVLPTLYRGVIIESFGNGGLPFKGRNLLKKVKQLIEANVAVVITTQCLEEGEHLETYEVGKKVAEMNVIVTGDMNTEAIVAKLMWALGQTKEIDEVKRLIEEPICFDRT